MKIDIWHISGDGFHFGRHGLGQEESGEHLPSDSLFSALLSRMAEMPQARQILDQVQADFSLTHPPFVLTSAFPRAGGLRFYPLPLQEPLAMPQTEGDNRIDAKRIKKIKYVSEKLFQRLLTGETLIDLFADVAQSPLYLQGDAIILSVEEMEGLPFKIKKENSIWTIEARPRVYIDRSQSAASIFLTGRTSYRPNCGFWFGIHIIQPDHPFSKILPSLLVDLADAGLGGSRSSGFGKATIKFETQIEWPEAGNDPWLTLSRYLPRENEMPAFFSELANYSIQELSGYAFSSGKKSERRKILHLVKEGSVLGRLDGMVRGETVDIQPCYTNGSQPLGHPVWRNGQALGIRIKRQSAGGQ